MPVHPPQPEVCDITMKVKIDTKQLNDVKAMLSGVGNAAPRVISRSLNKTITGVRTDAVKEIQKEITPKAKIIRDTMKLNRSTFKNLKASLESKGKSVPLIHYAARPVKAGVTVQVLKKNPRTLIRHAFIATMKSGHKGVFWREQRHPEAAKFQRPMPWFARLPKKYRLPIRELYGPSIPAIFGKDPVINPVIKNAGNRLDKNLKHELDFELNKL